MAVVSSQNKRTEVAFFDSHAASDAYDVFTPDTNDRLIDSVLRLGKFRGGAKVVDLGCGSGVFTDALRRRGYRCRVLSI